MEEPTFTAIDYNSLENKVIEGLVRDNYSKIKNTFYKVFNKRSKNPNSPVGLCADIIEASNYKDDPDRILWRKVMLNLGLLLKGLTLPMYTSDILLL